MNYSTAIFLISDKVRAVAVTYEPDAPHSPGSAARTIFKTMDAGIMVDDYVVVPTDTRHLMTVCKVADVNVEVDLESNVEMKWIVGTVDRVDFEAIKSQEGDAIATIKSAEKRRKREELRKALIADAGDALKKLPVFTARDED